MSINDSNQSTLRDPAHDAGHISGGEWFSARGRKNERRQTDFVIGSTIGNRFGGQRRRCTGIHVTHVQPGKR